jgi:hypothetical protein
MGFIEFLGFANVIGLFVSGPVYVYRAGFRDTGHDWREFAIPNIPWMFMTAGKCVVWWAVLITWLAQGRPSSPWKAITRDDSGREVRAIIRVSD